MSVGTVQTLIGAKGKTETRLAPSIQSTQVVKIAIESGSSKVILISSLLQ